MMVALQKENDHAPGPGRSRTVNLWLLLVRRSFGAVVASSQVPRPLRVGRQSRTRFARRRLRRAFLLPRLRSDTAGGPFLQKQLRRLHPRIRAEPLVNDAAVQQVGDRQQAHALVVDHPRLDEREALTPRGPHIAASAL